MSRRLTVTAFIATLVVAPALAQGPCLPRDVALRQLEAEYGERPLWHGLGDDGRMLEIVGTADGGSWTAFVSLPPSAEHPMGLSCVVATGQAWKSAPPHRPQDNRI